MHGIAIQQVAGFEAAVGIATTYAVAHHPFGAYRADRLVGSIVGQIQRRHYAFAIRDGDVIGYAGWALCTPEVAQAWLENGLAPTSEESNAGDTVVLMIVIADETQALRQLAAHVRRLYGRKVFTARRAERDFKAIRKGRFRG